MPTMARDRWRNNRFRRKQGGSDRRLGGRVIFRQARWLYFFERFFDHSSLGFTDRVDVSCVIDGHQAGALSKDTLKDERIGNAEGQYAVRRMWRTSPDIPYVWV